MVGNVYFETERWDPYIPPSIHPGPDKPMVIPKPVPGVEKLTRAKYQLDMQGRFRLEHAYFKLDRNEGDAAELRRESSPQLISFDGEIYHNLQLFDDDSSDLVGLASIFTPEHDFNTLGPAIKMTFFMDHLFNDRMSEFLLNPNLQVEQVNTNEWKISNPTPKPTDSIVKVVLDSSMAYMPTQVSGNWVEDSAYEKDIKWRKTADGFYYPAEGSLKLEDSNRTVVLTTTKFELNADESHDYVYEIPEGVRVADYTGGARREYYQGQPGRLEAERAPRK